MKTGVFIVVRKESHLREIVREVVNRSMKQWRSQPKIFWWAKKFGSGKMFDFWTSNTFFGTQRLKAHNYAKNF